MWHNSLSPRHRNEGLLSGWSRKTPQFAMWNRGLNLTQQDAILRAILTTNCHRISTFLTIGRIRVNGCSLFESLWNRSLFNTPLNKHSLKDLPWLKRRRRRNHPLSRTFTTKSLGVRTPRVFKSMLPIPNAF